MSGSEWNGWPSKELHDRVAAGYMKWLVQAYGGNDPYALNPARLPSSGSFCACCGTGYGTPTQGSVGTIRQSKLKDGVVTCPEGWDHIVIRDKDMEDIQITWKDA